MVKDTLDGIVEMWAEYTTTRQCTWIFRIRVYVGVGGKHFWLRVRAGANGRMLC